MKFKQLFTKRKKTTSELNVELFERQKKEIRRKPRREYFRFWFPIIISVILVVVSLYVDRIRDEDRIEKLEIQIRFQEYQIQELKGEILNQSKIIENITSKTTLSDTVVKL
jgi:uncharacterized coiled-coil protein SlyX